jgi:hypothetical protein
MSNPVDEYLKKYAAEGFGEMAKSVGQRAALLAGAIGLASAGTQVYRAITKKQDYNAMLEAHPDLAERRDQDPATFNRFYNALRSLNPQFAAEPVVAGTYMRRMLEAPEAAGGTLVESLQSSKGIGPSYSMTFGEHPSFGLKSA